MAAVRYIVSDIAPSVAFYRDMLSFEVDMEVPHQFAALSRDGLTLYLNVQDKAARGRPAAIPSPAGGTGSRSKPTTSTA